MKKLLAKIRKILKDRRTRRWLTRFVSGFAAVVVFVTTYALVLPAITMESEALCGIPAHQHDDSCYEQRLICGLPESESHQHTSSCYENVLVCGLEVHTHSPKCYKEEIQVESEAVEATDTAAVAAQARLADYSPEETEGGREESAGDGAEAETEALTETDYETEADSMAPAAEANENEADAPYGDNTFPESGTDTTVDSGDYAAAESGDYAAADSGAASASGESTESGSADRQEAAAGNGAGTQAGDRTNAASGDDAGAEAGAASGPDTAATADQAAGTDSTGAGNLQPDPAATEAANLQPGTDTDGYVPVLEALDFRTILNHDTDIYYHHILEGEVIEDSSAITSWTQADDQTALAPADLVRVYLAYTIPAGNLNETNAVARYRLPGNLHLTDAQIETINRFENGISGQYVDYDSLQITDVDKHIAYLGVEAVEGTRTPDQDINEYLQKLSKSRGGDPQAAQEYISATVKAENIYDHEGLYGEKGAFLGTDLIFTFSPYTVQKNRHEYDVSGQPTKAGETVRGWLTLDFNLSQVDWNENTAQVVFVAEDKDHGIGEISRTLTMELPEDSSEDNPEEADPAAENAAEDSTSAENTEENSDENAAEGNTSEEDLADKDQNKEGEGEETEDPAAGKTAEDADKTEKAEDADKAAAEVTEETHPAVNFEDTIKIRSGSLSTDTAAAESLPGTSRLTVSVSADACTFPAGTTMVLSAVEDMDAVASALEGTVDTRTKGFQAVDISFRDAEGKEIEPLKPIRVTMKSKDIKTAAEDSSVAPLVVHVEDQKDKTAEGETTGDATEGAGTGASEETAETTDNTALTSDAQAPVATVVETLEPTADAGSSSTGNPASKGGSAAASGDQNAADTLTFESDAFSVYAIVYTVDFHWEVGGKTYDFSIPGGGFVSFRKLIEILGIAGNDAQGDSENHTAEDQKAENTQDKTALTLDHVQVSEKTKEFVADVEKVEFSSPKLVWVGKNDAETTVGALKDANSLDCQYSAELTKEQIDKINAQTVEAGDWALISVQAFDTKETLTVTMKNEEVFTVAVTDAQIRKYLISASGDIYEIIVTYGDDAQIPEDAELRVKEIKEDSREYAEFQKDIADHLEDDRDKIPANPVLLDISIWDNDQKIEPAEGSKINVEVKLVKSAVKGMFTDENAPVFVNDAPVTEETGSIEKSMQVIHQVEEGKLEVVDTTDTISDDRIVSEFTTESFSNWLLFLDEDLTDINVTTGDSLTLRPYSEWIWKKTDELDQYKNGAWIFPSSDWTVTTWTEGNVTYTGYTHKTNGSSFRSFEKTDSQLNETYTVIQTISLSATNGGFDLQTNKGKVIHVHVTQGAASGKPDTVDGITGLTVNLFDYDVPPEYQITYEERYYPYYHLEEVRTPIPGTYDFTHSGPLDVESNVASGTDDGSAQNPNINTGHDLKFLGYGGSNYPSNGTNYGWFWINNYSKDDPQQGIVKEDLGDDGAPELKPNKNTSQERGNPSLAYLFDTNSRNNNVYAFPDADGLFQQDNQGYYYYNSNSNYAEYDRTNNRFILYEHTYSQNTGGSNGSNAKPIGFFPFHEYDTVDTQPEMNFNGALNHHFGMSMSVDFEIPKDRLMEDPSGNKREIVYEFSGDDDLWVFVDGKLALDIGGIHQPVTGKINFTTGVISVHGVDEDLHMDFSVGGHTLDMFYIERGGCDSNLSVRFNLPLTQGNGFVDIIKKTAVDNTADSDKPLAGALFGIWESPECEGEPYKTTTSQTDGKLDFGELPIKSDGQKYYLKEIKAPTGYLTSSKIYTLTARNQDADGEYTFSVTYEGEEIEKLTQEPYSSVIRNSKPVPINLSLHKAWQDAAGNSIATPDAHGVFELKRYKTETTEVITTEEGGPETTFRLYLVDKDWKNPTLLESKDYLRDSQITISWNFPSHYGYNNGEYRVGSLSAGDQTTSLSSYGGRKYASITRTIPAAPSTEVLEIYVRDGNGGTNYEGIRDLKSTGTTGAKETIIHTSFNVSDPVVDSTYSDLIELPKPNGSNDHTFENLPVQETDPATNTVYDYTYFITEKTVPAGYEAVYLDGNGNPIKASSTQTTNVDDTQTVVNRKLLDIPVEKYWPDFSGEQYTWTITFQLEELETKVNASDPDDLPANVHSSFTPIDGKVITITKGQTPIPQFEGLPMYRVHENGTVYRIQYSLGELAYEVKEGDTVVARWSKDGTVSVVGNQYTPQFEQDAGENGNSVEDYEIIVINTLRNLTATKEFNLGIHKTWPSGVIDPENEEQFAKFILKRYVHEEYRDYSNVNADTQWVNVTLKTDTAVTEEGSRLQTLRVPAGRTVYVVGKIKAQTNANKIAFRIGDSPDTIDYIYDNSLNTDPYEFSVSFTANEDMLVNLTQGDNYVIGGRDGFRLSDTYGNKTTDMLDANFNEEFVLNNSNDWTKVFEYLSAIEEDDHEEGGGNQTVHVYSYFLVEDECNPADFSPVFRDSNGQIIGDDIDRFFWDTTITAENEPVPGSLKITKIVHVNGDAPETDAQKQLVDGDYLFTVNSCEGISPAVTKYVRITVSDGQATSYRVADSVSGLDTAAETLGSAAYVSGLLKGSYTIAETELNGMTLESAVRDDNDESAVSEEHVVTVNVTAGVDAPSGASAAAATFTNNIETTNVKIVKEWVHGSNTNLPESLTVNLSNGESRILNVGNQWQATISDLRKYDNAGNLIDYSWTEAELPAGYYLSDISTDTDETTGTVITTLKNTFTDQYNPLTSYTGTKTWDDNGDKRPATITVNLYADGELVDSKTVSAADTSSNTWTYEFTNLPVFNSDGTIIQYTTDEVLPEGYEKNTAGSPAEYMVTESPITVVEPATTENQKISSGTDLGFIVIGHGNDFVVWTPRVATEQEKTKIINAVIEKNDKEFSSIRKFGYTYISGVPMTVDVGSKHAVSVFMQGEDVYVRFLHTNAYSEFAYGSIEYSYTPAAGSITNIQKLTDFEFSKQWMNIIQEEIEWDRDIQVTVRRKKADGTVDGTFSLVYEISGDAIRNASGDDIEFSATGSGSDDPKLKLVITTEGGKKKYSFKLDGLPYYNQTDGKYTYYAVETNAKLEGYLDPTYTNVSAPTGVEMAYNDGTIINKQEGYELPSTGGTGTRPLFLLGAALIAMACAIVLRRRNMDL